MPATAHRPAESLSSFSMVVGLEVHVRLRTRTKAFCGCANEWDAAPNTHVCPICLGFPGTLPSLNEKAVTFATRAALMLGAQIAPVSWFERKSYFYPDLPRGYQITQHTAPFATGGAVEIGTGPQGEVVSVGIERIGLEEDAARLAYDSFPGHAAIDFNRAGVPLLEIVTAPEIGSAEEAVAFLRVLRQLLEYANVSDLSMERGSFRVDANVSVRPPGDGALQPRCEVKNMNSFAAVHRAVEAEFARQRAVVESGGQVVSRTMFWETDAGQLREGRMKEPSPEYRYFPDPDLPPLLVERDWIRRIQAVLPESPRERASRIASRYALPENTVEALTASVAVADYFENVAVHVSAPRRAAAWVLGEVLPELRSTGVAVDEIKARPVDLAELVEMIEQGVVSTTAARRIFRIMAGTGERPASIAARKGLLKVDDAMRINDWVDEAIRGAPDLFERLRAGDDRLRHVLIGQVMKLSGGAADPRVAERLLAERLEL